MPFFTSPVDGAQLHYIDYTPANAPHVFSPANGQHSLASSPVTLMFIHGWPMSSQMWEHLTLKLSETHRIRCVASDRRGFGKSEWTGTATKGGNITYDTFAQDTAAWVDSLNLESFVFVAASMGCGETLLTYNLFAPELREKCKGFIWMGPSMPFPLKTEAHPEAPPREIWDMLIQGFRDDRVGFVRVSLPGVFGMRPQFDTGIEVPATVLERYERIVARADALAIERCVQIMTHRDFTDELKRLEGKKVLVLHGDSDQGMPASCSANLIGEYVKDAKVRIMEKAAHGLYLTHAEKVIEEIVVFVSGF